MKENIFEKEIIYKKHRKIIILKNYLFIIFISLSSEFSVFLRIISKSGE
jgi:hypothetical protein